MKTLKYYKLVTLLFAAVFTVSCVQDDDFDLPNLDVTPPTLSGTEISINNLKQLYLQELADGNDLVTIENDIYITGYVISNDEFGNFFEEIILQDAASNPTTGVKVLVNVSPLFIFYEFGRRTHVQLQGLTIGLDGGVLSIGVRDGNRLGKIAEPQMTDFIIRNVEVEEITPLPMSISEFNINKTNLYIRLNNMQFHRNDVLGDNPKTYAAEPGDQFDGERILESCDEGIAVIFSTSTFADFRTLSLPTGSGTIDGILTLNFFGDMFNFVINTPETVNFDSTDRCDPTETDCGIATSTGANELFSEFFESQTEGTPITGNGWTNYIEEGSREWRTFFNDGTNSSLGLSATIGSFGSGDDSTIAWLITPEFDFDAQDGETLNFKTSNSFADGSTLNLLFSDNWDGTPSNIASATWNLIPAAYIVEDDDFFGDWFPSGNVSLDCITGTGHIAFRYQGSDDEGFDGSYELDEIELKSN